MRRRAIMLPTSRDTSDERHDGRFWSRWLWALGFNFPATDIPCFARFVMFAGGGSLSGRSFQGCLPAAPASFCAEPL